MANEVIDLTASPPPPPPPPPSESTRILRLTSAKRFQFKIKKACSKKACRSWDNQNPNLSYINQQVTPWVPGQIYEPPQITANLQNNMHGDRALAAVYQPAVASNSFIFPQGTKLKEHWSPQEHEQFLMGLVKYGRGRWTKIARHFVWNKTPQQVQSYATSFFRHLPTTYLYSFRKKNSACFISADDDLSRNGGNLMAMDVSDSAPACASASNAMMAMEELPPILPLFPVETPFLAPGEETSSSAFAGLKKQTYDDAAPSMAATGEIDLELRLG